MRRGIVHWDCMKKIQIVYRGHKPIHSQISTIVVENGDTLNSHGDVSARWRHHFLIVLNVHSSIQEEAVNSVMRLPVRDHLDDVPSCEEVQLAIDHLKNCKAAGKSGLLLELLICTGSVIVEKLVELFDSVWRDGYVNC